MNITNIKTQTTTTNDYSATMTTAETKNSAITYYNVTKPRNICVAYIISKLLPNNVFNTTTNIWDLVKNN
jgi:hypothetical protein